jgi:hypothetical protein
MLVGERPTQNMKNSELRLRLIESFLNKLLGVLDLSQVAIASIHDIWVVNYTNVFYNQGTLWHELWSSIYNTG